MELLRAEGLVKKYGRRTVVNGVSLHVNAGEIVGILGPNGAGENDNISHDLRDGSTRSRAGVAR